MSGLKQAIARVAAALRDDHGLTRFEIDDLEHVRGAVGGRSTLRPLVYLGLKIRE